jgi:hypothetical protein
MGQPPQTEALKPDILQAVQAGAEGCCESFWGRKVKVEKSRRGLVDVKKCQTGTGLLINDILSLPGTSVRYSDLAPVKKSAMAKCMGIEPCEYGVVCSALNAMKPFYPRVSPEEAERIRKLVEERRAVRK